MNCTTVQGQDLQAEKILGWDFQRQDDQNMDKSPDGWRRRQDRQHPAYIVSKIVARDESRAREANREQLFVARLMHAAEKKRWDPNYVPEAIPPQLSQLMDRYVFDNCLEVTMDGGAAEIVSPTFLVDPRFRYSLKVEVNCQGLNGHDAWAELQLLDENEELVESLATQQVTGTSDWQFVATSASSPSRQNLRWGRVHLRVEPRDQLLINGVVRFDSISVHCLPRLSLTMDLPEHIALPGQEFSVQCSAMGIRLSSPTVRFELRDHLQQLLNAESVPLVRTAPPSAPTTRPPSDSGIATQGTSPPKTSATPHYVSTVAKPDANATPLNEPHLTKMSEETFDGNAIWKLKLDTPGLYRVSVALGDGDHRLDREVLIGVMEEHTPFNAGPFGWSLPDLEQNITPERLPYFVERFGAGWVKFPVWFDEADTATADRLTQLTKRLELLGTQCVGRIDQPPESQRELFGEANEHFSALVVFRDGQVWEPVLEPVLTRMGTKIDWFQIGSDDDRSFQNHPALPDLISGIRSRMQNYSQELKLALCWTWLDSPHDDSGLPWNALHFGAEPKLTAEELLSYTTEFSKQGNKLWVSIDPLDEHKYSLIDRVRDLTERMVVVKQTGIGAAFVNDPFHNASGLFRDGQSLGELLIPWTLIVAAIGDKAYVGPVDLPAGSFNHTFADKDDGVMLIWSDAPKTEELYLGEQITATDLWGRKVAVEQVTRDNGVTEQRIQVDRWPIIVYGIDTNVARWRQKFKLGVESLAISINDRQELPITVVNTLAQPATGKVSLHGATLLGSSVAEAPLQLGSAGEQELSLPLNIRPDASAGKHPLRFDIEAMTSGENHRFSVYREITLGAGDIEFKWDLSRKNDDIVELRVELTNNTPQATSFDCKYFPAGKPYQRFQILDARPGITLRDINLKISPEDERNGAWLRCEEIGSGRVLNYRFSQ